MKPLQLAIFLLVSFFAQKALKCPDVSQYDSSQQIFKRKRKIKSSMDIFAIIRSIRRSLKKVKKGTYLINFRSCQKISFHCKFSFQELYRLWKCPKLRKTKHLLALACGRECILFTTERSK